MGKHRTLATVGVISSLAVLSCALFYFRQQRERRRQKSYRFLVSHAATLQDKKPQEVFGCVLADNSRTPFVHLRTEENWNGLFHPYGERIRKLLEHPPLSCAFMQPGYEEPPGMEVYFQWIETKDELQALVKLLSDENEIAVDTEQHSFHSFRGFTALVQISTKTTDYLVDSIALHDSMSMLRPIFANPRICKVFHGADSDILWLQRDFHIYVVNMFDTAKACLLLRKQQRSLASLLQLYCSVTTDKSFQRADWRLRPLPKDMLQYARTDAHYLLYIAHRLCTELTQNISDERMEESGTDVESNYLGRPLEQAIYRSNLNCLNLYEKDGASASPTSTATHLISRYYNSHGCLPPSQLPERFTTLVTNLCEWRDSVVRVEDESLGSILSDTALIALAVSGPSTLERIYATIAAANSTPVPEVAVATKTRHRTSHSPIGQKYMNDLYHIIQRSGSGPSDEPPLKDMTPRISLEWLVEKILSIFKLSGTVGEDDKHLSQDGFLVNASQYKASKRQGLASTEKSRIQFVKKFSCKAPVYHNCRIYSDDGRLLCFCDRKKLEWYVKRGLAEYVEEEPPSVRLLFEPKGLPEYEDNDFYIQSKSNHCVGCGESSHYLRYRIIPSCYRQHFPEHLKSHRSHDIVLLCVDCHEIAHKAAEKYKRQIALEYGIPLFAKVTGAEGMIGGQTKAVVYSESEGGVSPLQLKNAAMALLRHGSTIPTPRRAELEKVVQTYYGRDNISVSDLHSVLLLSTGPQEHGRALENRLNNGEGATAGSVETPNKNQLRNEYPNNQAAGLMESQSSFKRKHSRHKARRKESLLGHGIHGRLVVEILIEREGDEEILKFCQRWRRVFVDAIHPTFLPLGWEIEHSGRREFGDFSIFKPLEDWQTHAISHQEYSTT